MREAKSFGPKTRVGSLSVTELDLSQLKLTVLLPGSMMQGCCGVMVAAVGKAAAIKAAVMQRLQTGLFAGGCLSPSNTPLITRLDMVIRWPNSCGLQVHEGKQAEV